jgi:hypothetical protein
MVVLRIGKGRDVEQLPQCLHPSEDHLATLTRVVPSDDGVYVLFEEGFGGHPVWPYTVVVVAQLVEPLEDGDEPFVRYLWIRGTGASLFSLPGTAGFTDA